MCQAKDTLINARWRTTRARRGGGGGGAAGVSLASETPAVPGSTLRYRYGASGKVNEKTEPRSTRLRTVIAPPMASTRLLEM